MAEGGAPALPWADTQPEGADVNAVQDTDAGICEQDLKPVSMQQLGLEPGARIEVMWEVTPDEGEAYGKWFAASISCSSSMPAQDAPAHQQAAAAAAPAAQEAPAQAAAQDAPTQAAEGAPSTSGAPSKQPHQQHRYTLKYDGSEEFPEETATVLLLTDHDLYDCERRDAMLWRLEGDTWEPPEDSDDEDMEVSAEEAAEAEAALMDRLSSMTQSESQKAQVVAGLKDFKQMFKEFVAAKAACADGGQVLITSADVTEFSAMMRTQLATSHRR